jgi:hypothetical protein
MVAIKSVLEFQRIYKKNFGAEISFDEAREQGMRLLELFKIVYKPLKINNNQNEKNSS